MLDTPKPQSWDNCDEDIKSFIDKLVAKLKSYLDNNLVGIYLHGSLAIGSYYRPKSDIDLLVVVHNKLKPPEREIIAKIIAEHSLSRPTVGDAELSIILTETAKHIPVPVPFEVHYSSKLYEDIMFGNIDYIQDNFDTDLQAHLTWVIQRGVCLMGKPIKETFGNIDWQIFWDGVLDDYQWIISDENILETPFYGVLNICRTLQFFEEQSQELHSKDEGGEWALKNLPREYHPIIQQALDAYRSPKQVDKLERRTNGEVWDREKLLAFRDYAKAREL